MKVVYGTLGIICWFLALLGILSFLSGVAAMINNPGGFLGFLTFTVLWVYGGYWAGKNFFKLGKFKFLK